MIWIDNINDLEYYTPPKAPQSTCYGDILFTPNDLILQGQVPDTNRNDYSITVETLTTDGLTVYADVTSYFSYYFGRNTSGQAYFNLVLNSWPDSMCTNGCFILRVTVTDANSTIIWRKYTQKYLVGACDTVASGVSITKKNDTNSIEIDCFSSTPMNDNCGNVYKQLYTTFNCMDEFSGDYYGLPIETYKNNITPFKFYRSSWLLADVYYNPLEIKRTISINCRPLKVERTRKWTLISGNITFPLWKVMEIENQLMSENIYFNGKAYSYTGDTPFERLIKQECLIPNDFKLRCVLSECYGYQLFGCSTPCD